VKGLKLFFDVTLINIIQFSKEHYSFC
jgi:hypothetical protein